MRKRTEPNDQHGTIYVMTNPAMPGLVKIGMTKGTDITKRMSELYTTGVPVPFECAYICSVRIDECQNIEKAFHKAFELHRINPNREFFKIPPENVIAVLKLFDQKDITKETKEKINENIPLADLKAGEKLKRSQRPPLNFKDMGIDKGEKLVYIKNTDIEVEVCADKKVLYKGKETSLTAITQKIMGITRPIQPTPHWSYNGQNLQDIYNDTYERIE